ncbi:MAG: hypothetical protein ACKPKO_08055, partial [Candidatus Fonsibacter sp.]
MLELDLARLGMACAVPAARVRAMIGDCHLEVLLGDRSLRPPQKTALAVFVQGQLCLDVLEDG